jgi:hypothetical protein
MHVAVAQQGLLHIAKLIEAKQRVVAGAAEMSVVGSAFLLAVGLAHGTVHVQDQFPHRLAFPQPVSTSLIASSTSPGWLLSGRASHVLRAPEEEPTVS